MSKWIALPATLLVLAMAVAPAAGAEELAGYSGAKLFERFCASCHGPRGEGDGPVAPFFKLAPPDLTRIARRHGGEFPSDQVRRIIDGRTIFPPHGSRAMPVWGLEFIWVEGSTPQAQERAETLIVRLVDYLRSIQVP